MDATIFAAPGIVQLLGKYFPILPKIGLPIFVPKLRGKKVTSFQASFGNLVVGTEDLFLKWSILGGSVSAEVAALESALQTSWRNYLPDWKIEKVIWGKAISLSRLVDLKGDKKEIAEKIWRENKPATTTSFFNFFTAPSWN